MRTLAWIAVACLQTSQALADGAAAKVAAGEDLAKRGRLTEAIESFKAADKIEKRAKHACLIALAYIRRELWPQAQIFLSTCHERANASDPVPDWVPLAEQQLKDRLAKAKVAPVNIRVLPEDLASRAMIGVSSFEPDELFTPRTVHLGRGKHLITATVDGRTAARAIEIGDQRAREVVIDFDAKQTGVLVPVPAPTRPQGPRTSRVPLILLGLGGAMLVGGGAYHLFAFKPARDELAATTDPAEYDRLEGDFDSKRIATIAVYTAGAVTMLAAVVLKATVFEDKERAPTASLITTPGGGVLALEWRR